MPIPPDGYRKVEYLTTKERVKKHLNYQVYPRHYAYNDFYIPPDWACFGFFAQLPIFLELEKAPYHAYRV